MINARGRIERSRNKAHPAIEAHAEQKARRMYHCRSIGEPVDQLRLLLGGAARHHSDLDDQHLVPLRLLVSASSCLNRIGWAVGDAKVVLAMLAHVGLLCGLSRSK